MTKKLNELKNEELYDMVHNAQKELRVLRFTHIGPNASSHEKRKHRRAVARAKTELTRRGIHA